MEVLSLVTVKAAQTSALVVRSWQHPKTFGRTFGGVAELLR